MKGVLISIAALSLLSLGSAVAQVGVGAHVGIAAGTVMKADISAAMPAMASTMSMAAGRTATIDLICGRISDGSR